MKRILMLVLLLVFLCPDALAETVRENVNAPEHITGEFQSPSGRTHIYVDADVLIPDAPCLSTYQVTARTFTLTTSPRETASEGCLMKRSQMWEICTRPS